ncbi:MAG: aspartyl/asparaginyl beta-hydroxylase domain-containing protein [Candidatus Adlerbacteria bacterium]|nr:aspartyl/asparaginyl beta-hydroxylase domain-containing protein [Candidatus Adlerbacteria bacterium]
MFVDRIDSLFGLVPTLLKIEEGVETDVFESELFDEGGGLKFATPSQEWPHREAFHLFLRTISQKEFLQKGFPGNVIESVNTDLYVQYPKLTAWIDAFARQHSARVGRIIIAALKPKSQVYRHADRGYYFAPRDRYHLVLQSTGGEMVIAGQEETLRQGEVWWINNKAAHQSFNNSDQVRIHLIFDLLPNSFWKRATNYLRWIYLGLRPKRLTNYYFNWPARFQATS